MNKSKRLEFISLTKEEKKQIKRDTLKELYPNKFTDNDLDFQDISVKHFFACDKLIEEANNYIANNLINQAIELMQRCIFKYHTTQPEVYYIVAEIIDDKNLLKDIIQFYEDNKYLRDSKKLLKPIEFIKLKSL